MNGKKSIIKFCQLSPQPTKVENHSKESLKKNELALNYKIDSNPWPRASFKKSLENQIANSQ